MDKQQVTYQRGQTVYFKGCAEHKVLQDLGDYVRIQTIGTFKNLKKVRKENLSTEQHHWYKKRMEEIKKELSVQDAILEEMKNSPRY